MRLPTPPHLLVVLLLLLLLVLLLLLLLTGCTTLHATPFNMAAMRGGGCASHLPDRVTRGHRLLLW